MKSSLRQQFGLGIVGRRIPPAERGVAEMMFNLYKSFADPLAHETMFAWHKMLMSGARRLDVVGNYRTHPEPMRVVSGPIHNHFGRDDNRKNLRFNKARHERKQSDE